MARGLTVILIIVLILVVVIGIVLLYGCVNCSGCGSGSLGTSSGSNSSTKQICSG